MHSLAWFKVPVIAVLFLLCALPAMTPASALPDYSITYTIAVTGDGTALWTVEYRTPLLTDNDLDAFENYSREMNAVYLPEFQDLMQRSAAQAALGTSRDMAVNNFTGNALVQTSPTGKFGVVTYTFAWTHFAQTGNGLSIGDAFIGGMYLARDQTLIIRYPQGYTVSSAAPVPDQTGEGLTWYGLRSFGPGQPRIVFEGTPFPFLPVGAFLLLIVVIAVIVFYRRRMPAPEANDAPDGEDAEGPAAPLSKADLESLEEKIVQLLVGHNGEQFQSDIVKQLGVPKSSVSATLNDLHQRGIIQKVRKGRENLIRLIKRDV